MKLRNNKTLTGSKRKRSELESEGSESSENYELSSMTHFSV